MNSICSTDRSKCECREDKKWNKEKLECQVNFPVIIFVVLLNNAANISGMPGANVFINFTILQVYMDVDCSDLDSGKEEEEVTIKPETKQNESSGII